MNERPRGASPADGMDQWLRDTLASERGPASSDCLDPETLGAWAEGALSGSERSFAEAHAARCARCQSMLAVMARTVPPAAPTPSPLRKWLMMLTPVAAAAAAVALWFAVDPRDAVRPLPGPTSTVARDDRTAGGPAAPPPAASADKEVASSPNAVPPGDSRNELKDSSRLNAGSRKVPAPADKIEPTQQRELRGELDAGRTPASSARVAEAPAAPPPPSVAASAAEQKQSSAGQQQAVQAEEARQRRAAQERVVQSPPLQSPQQSAQQAPAPPQAPARPVESPAGPKPAAKPAEGAAAADRTAGFLGPTPPAGAGAGRGGGTRSDSLFRTGDSPAMPAVVSPDGTTRWRAAGALVQQSIDGGATWSTQLTLDPKTILVAGGASSSTTCWFVGRAGAIVATFDGRAWRRVAFPLAVDLVSVSSTDMLNAAVVTSDGRTFVTTDSGGRWTLRKE